MNREVREYMSKIGKRGGKARTDKKAKAVTANLQKWRDEQKNLRHNKPVNIG